MHRLITIWMVAFVALCIPECLQAQEPVPRVVTSSDLLGEGIHEHIFDIEIDSNGYALLCGSLIARFNGRSIIHLKETKTGRDAYTKIFRGRNGRLWVGSHRGLLYYVSRDSLLKFPLPDTFQHIHYPEFEALYEDEAGAIHLAIRNMGYVIIKTDGSVDWVSNRLPVRRGVVVTRMEDGTPFFFFRSSKDTVSHESIYFWDQKGVLKHMGDIPERAMGFESSLVEGPGGTLLFSNGQKSIARIENDSLISIHQFAHDVIKLFYDSHDDLWIGTVKKGLFKAHGGNLDSLSNFLPDDAAAVVAEDHTGGLWLKSGQFRFGYLRFLATEHFSEQNGFSELRNPSKLASDGQRVFCLSGDSGLQVIDGNRVSSIQTPTSESEITRSRGEWPWDIYFNTVTNELWLGYKGMVSVQRSNRWNNIPLPLAEFKNHRVTDMTHLPNGDLLACTQSKVFTVRDEHMQVLSEHKPGRTLRCIATDERGSTWVAGMDGIWQLRNEAFVRPEGFPKNLASESICAIAYTHDFLWILFEDFDLYRWDGTELHPCLDAQGQIVKGLDMQVGPDGDLWVRARGVRRLGWNEGLVVSERYVLDDGPSAIFVNGGMAVTDDAIYVCSSRGVFRTKLNSLKKRKLQWVTVLTDIRVNDVLVPQQSHYALEHDQNNLNFAFDGINYFGSKVSYRYQLEGQDTGWIVSDYDRVQYTNLPPGEYAFKVQSSLGLIGWNEPITARFTIATPYWNTWWFRGFLFLAAALIIWSGAALYYRYQQRQAFLQLQQLKSEQKALRAQLNPHFIFNVIASVQNLLLHAQPEKVADYLGHFAQLIRNVLDSSFQSLVPLSSELKQIEHYLKLEQVRLNHSFDYTIDSSNADGDTLIPPALLQPYIENAIWHGIQPKERDGFISLKVIAEKGLLRFIIEDNGIGRQASARGKHPTHPTSASYGMRLSANRIELLNKEKGNHAEVSIHDITAEDGQICGTRVQLALRLGAS